VLSANRSANRPCVIGSVKTNIGHLEPAAGIAGLIKAALALQHRQIPANLHFQQPNPDLDFTGLPLRVSRTLQPGPEAAAPALARVNSFGFGGTNAHALLQEPPREERGARSEERAAQRGHREHFSSCVDPRSSLLAPHSSFLVPLSARSPEALTALA